MAIPTIEASPGIAKMSFYPGDDLSFPVTIQDGAGLPINLDHYTIEAAITNDDENILEFDATIVNAALGQTLITMDSATTIQVIDKSKWYYKLIDPNNKVQTIMLGVVNLQQIWQTLLKY